MALYPKKLKNREDLEREKRALLREKEELEKSDPFSIEGLLGNSKKEGGEEGPGGLFDLLQGSGPLAGIISGLVKKGFEKMDKKSGAAKPEEKKENSLLKSLAKEFIGGYLKWKAIELSYKGIRYLIRSRKEKE